MPLAEAGAEAQLQRLTAPMTLLERSKADLPRATRDMSRVFEDLEVFGYGVLEGALSAERVAALRTRVIEQAAGEDARGVGFHDGKVNQRIWMLPNKGRI